MKPRLVITRFAFAILIVLSLLAGRGAAAKEAAPESGGTLSPAGLSVAGEGDAAWNVTAPSAEQIYSVYLPAMIKPSTGSPPSILSFTASPASTGAGESSLLSWSVSGATSLNISPGVGAVTGSSTTVRPATTTQYTLTAANAFGSASAQTTVTVVSAPPSSASFFIEPLPSIDRPTSHPTVMVDTADGVHIVFTPESVTPDHPKRSVLYAYCPSNCSSAAAFTITELGDDVEYANLALTPAGKPRVMARLRPPSSNVFVYQYWTCDSNCTQAAQWSGTSVGAAYARATGWGEPFSRFFALDHVGRPRFVYYDAGADIDDPHWGAFYAYCDAGCGSAVNWQEARLIDDVHASEFALTFSPMGQPRLAYTSYDSEAIAPYVAYAECEANCASVANWYGLRLVDTASASVTEFATLALRSDSNGRPRLALYTGSGLGGTLTPNTLYYLSCAAAPCTQGQSWQALDLGLPSTHGEAGVDLALDGQNRPRIAYHAPMAAGFGLHYAWCNANCETSAQSWQYQEIEASETVNQEMPIPPWPGCSFPECNPPIPPCTISTWDTGMRPSLALDAAGQPRVAYDADHQQGGACGTFTDAKLARFAMFNQP
jgi:hypothetical protein